MHTIANGISHAHETLNKKESDITFCLRVAFYGDDE